MQYIFIQMKEVILTLAIALISTITFATEIVATVVFENSTNKTFTSGEFRIIDLNEKTQVTTAASFHIILPEKGSYKFSFTAEDFTAIVSYPPRINKRNNTIRVKLIEKVELKRNKTLPFPSSFKIDVTDEQIEKRIIDGTLNFIVHGVTTSTPEDDIPFKEKYGIGIVRENCESDSFQSKKAKENNQLIFEYLNRKYGFKWLDELNEKPFGIKE